MPIHELQGTLAVDLAEVADLAVGDLEDWQYLRSTSRVAAASVGPSLPIIDLFSGLGGMTLGALEGARRSARAAHLELAVDNVAGPLDVLGATLDAQTACQSVNLREVLQPVANAPTKLETKVFGDVPADGLLVAGPPCQGHSTLNNYTRHDDPRNDLYLAVARVARLIEAKAVVIENVRGISSDRRRSLDRCTAALQELGYDVTGKTLDLHTVGVPQRRVRSVLVATREEGLKWTSLPVVASRTVRWAIEDLEDADAGEPINVPARMAPQNVKRIAWLFENDAWDLPNPERPKCHQDDGHSYASMYGRLHWDKPAQTITSGFGSMGQGRYVHPSRRRTLTPHEAARLQFLPDFVKFGDVACRRNELATMIGNVAPPKLTMAIVEALIAQHLL